MTGEVTHLVLGDVAAGVLGDAMRAGMPAAAPILRFRDIYCLGPLGALGGAHGAQSRARYWAKLLPCAAPAIDEFDAEEARYEQAVEAARRGPVCLWTGAHSSSQLWLQRLCAVFSSQGAEVRLVDAAAPGTTAGGRRSMSQFEPSEFGELLACLRTLDGGEVARLAAEWQRNRCIPSGVRRWTDGSISHHGDDFYDRLLLAQCDEAWQAADRVIGAAQWDCDEFLGDVFFAWRLRCLAESGRLLWRGPRGSSAEALVRLAVAERAQGIQH